MLPESCADRQGRREFLRLAATGAAGLAFACAGAASEPAKPLRGLFPIGQTPFTPDDKLDLA